MRVKAYHKVDLRCSLAIASVIFVLMFIIALPITFTKILKGTQTTTPSAGTPTTFPDKSSQIDNTSILYPLISAAQFGTATVMVTRDNSNWNLWWRAMNHSRWITDWKKMDDKKPPQIEAFTTFSVADDSAQLVMVYPDYTIGARTFRQGKWESSFDLDGGVIGTPSACSSAVGVGELMVIGTGHGPFHKRYLSKTEWKFAIDNDPTYNTPQQWDASGGWCASNLLTSCATGRLDMVTLGNYGVPHHMFYQYWSRSGVSPGFSTWIDLGGDYVGDPAIITRGDQVDMFGLDRNNGSYIHISGLSSNFTNRVYTDLGGPMQSAPQVISLGPNRLDLFAIGSSDRQLWHRSSINNTWSPSWTSLGGIFMSAPTVVALQEKKVMVLGISENNTIFHGNWTVNLDSFEWRYGHNWLVDKTEKMAVYINRGDLRT